jgi:hypothetical protein
VADRCRPPAGILLRARVQGAGQRPAHWSAVPASGGYRPAPKRTSQHGFPAAPPPGGARAGKAG